jgi:hypothetical protein
MSKKGSTSGKGNELRLIAEDTFNDHEVEVIDTAVVEAKKVERAESNFVTEPVKKIETPAFIETPVVITKQ